MKPIPCYVSPIGRSYAASRFVFSFSTNRSRLRRLLDYIWVRNTPDRKHKPIEKAMQTLHKETALDTFPVLHTERLDLIEITQAHLGDLFKLFGDEEVTRFYNLLPLEKEQEAQKLIDWFQSRFKEKLGIRWGIALKGNPNIIGTIGFNSFTTHHRANLGYDLQSDHWNKGYITEALRVVIDFGFNQLEVNRIEAEIMPLNVVSDRVLAKLGFTNEGILRQWMFWNDKYYDMTMYSLLKSDKSNSKH